jgi:hypothetical protein
MIELHEIEELAKTVNRHAIKILLRNAEISIRDAQEELLERYLV